MTAKQQAIKDIQDELDRNKKTFIPFLVGLNPIMGSLVDAQLKKQGVKRIPSRKSGQLVAHCLCLSKDKVEYSNYSKYYAKIK
jgi:hypothetical protein